VSGDGRRPGGRAAPARLRCAAAAFLAAAGLLVAAGCGSKPVFRAEPMSPPSGGSGAAPAPAPPAVVSKAAVEAAARPWLGTPYRYGGYDRRGIDCSALCQNILGDLGATLPRTAESQSIQGWPVAAGGLEAGDLVFFRLGSSRINHVGVMLDRTRFVHASSSRGVVIDRLMAKYFSRRFAGGRRILHGSADGEDG